MSGEDRLSLLTWSINCFSGSRAFRCNPLIPADIGSGHTHVTRASGSSRLESRPGNPQLPPQIPELQGLLNSQWTLTQSPTGPGTLHGRLCWSRILLIPLWWPFPLSPHQRHLFSIWGTMQFMERWFWPGPQVRTGLGQVSRPTHCPAFRDWFWCNRPPVQPEWHSFLECWGKAGLSLGQCVWMWNHSCAHWASRIAAKLKKQPVLWRQSGESRSPDPVANL